MIRKKKTLAKFFKKHEQQHIGTKIGLGKLDNIAFIFLFLVIIFFLSL